MIFAISMDYTVFLLSSAKEHWDRTHDAREAMVGGVAHSGRVIFAAAAVMVAVFFTFALSGPLPPKEMGIILGVAVLLDAFLIRLLLLPVLLRVMGRGRGIGPLGRAGASRRALRTRLSQPAEHAQPRRSSSELAGRPREARDRPAPSLGPAGRRAPAPLRQRHHLPLRRHGARSRFFRALPCPR